MTEHFEPIFHEFHVCVSQISRLCPTALLTLTEHWEEELDKHKVIGAVAMNLTKAFDCLPHDLILEKLEYYGLDEKAVVLLRSYLSSRYQRVKFGNTSSSWMGVSAGVPQGSILGPMLFNIFMNDLTYAIQECKLVNYADDTRFFLSHRDPQAVEVGVNKDSNNTTKWFLENGMPANPENYQALRLGMNIECCKNTIFYLTKLRSLLLLLTTS